MSDSAINTPPSPPRVTTGVPGLDEILNGGFPKGHLYLVQGESGAGKTTLGLQFLAAGCAANEPTLWISLSETQDELRQIAESHGLSLDGVELCNPMGVPRAQDPDEQYSFFSPADVELEEIRAAIVKAVDRVRPTRVVFDPFSDIRHLARDVLRYRRYVLALRQFFSDRQCTVLLMHEVTRGAPGDLQVEALVHGYITMHQDSPEFGGQRRRLRVHKMRGMSFRDGYHDFAITTGGIEVYPRLIALDYTTDPVEEVVSSGLPALDALLGGGIDRGSSLLIVGAAGVGKSTMASQYASAAAERGEKAAIFIFDETSRTFRARTERLGLPFDRHVEAGTISLRHLDAAEVSPGQFAHLVMREVSESGATIVVIDSLSGYLHAMPEERFLSTHLHELLTGLSHQNVATIVTLAQHGLVGERIESPADVSYLADNVMLLRYFEAFGAVRRAISVVKKRSGAHETLVREMRIARGGIVVGEPLTDFNGVLTGRPEYVGRRDQLTGGGQ